MNNKTQEKDKAEHTGICNVCNKSKPIKTFKLPTKMYSPTCWKCRHLKKIKDKKIEERISLEKYGGIEITSVSYDEFYDIEDADGVLAAMDALAKRQAMTMFEKMTHFGTVIVKTKEIK